MQVTKAPASANEQFSDFHDRVKQSAHKIIAICKREGFLVCPIFQKCANKAIKKLSGGRTAGPGLADLRLTMKKSFIGSVISLATSLVVLTTFPGCAGNSNRQSTGEYIDDHSTTSRVKSALSDDPQFKFSMVEVKTFKGTAQLSGFVASAEAKKKAGDIAKSVSGVRDVENDILVKEND